MITPIKNFLRGSKPNSLSFPIITLAIMLTFIVGISSNQVNAQQVSPQQIEQFKKLPKSQQQALAQSMGVDFSAIEQQLNGSSKSSGQSENTKTYPRDTQPEKEEQEILKENDGLKPFGYDVFANAPQTFSPVMDIAIPAEYIIGPGDKLSIQVFGKETKELELSVNREGQVILPSLGPFTVSGLSFYDVKHLLTYQLVLTGCYVSCQYH